MDWLTRESRILLPLLVVACVPGSASCASTKLRRAAESQSAYESCVERHAEDPTECESLRRRAGSDFENYEASGLPESWSRTWTP